MGEDDEDYCFEPQVNQSVQQSDLNDGTIQNLQMLSPPSVGNNYNLASYGEEERPYEGTMSSQRTGKSHVELNKSATKKEREMIEVAKLIQQAANTANNIFEQSENFRAKVKHHKDQDSKPVRQNSRKSIKTVDPYKNAESKI